MSLSDQVVMATSIETLIELLKNLPNYGRVSYVVTAKGDEVKTAFDIVDASALLVSNTLDGKINPDYPQETSAARPDPRIQSSSGQPDIQGFASCPAYRFRFIQPWRADNW